MTEYGKVLKIKQILRFWEKEKEQKNGSAL